MTDQPSAPGALREDAAFPRRLLPDERHIFDVLLAEAFEGREELQAQVDAATVTGYSCKCGCPSLAISVDRSAPPVHQRDALPEGFGVDANGNVVGVFFSLDDSGYLYDLDVWCLGPTVDDEVATGIQGKPTVESFVAAHAHADAVAEAKRRFKEDRSRGGQGRRR